jgi:hypothetical protein
MSVAGQTGSFDETTIVRITSGFPGVNRGRRTGPGFHVTGFGSARSRTISLTRVSTQWTALQLVEFFPRPAISSPKEPAASCPYTASATR